MRSLSGHADSFRGAACKVRKPFPDPEQPPGVIPPKAQRITHVIRPARLFYPDASVCTRACTAVPNQKIKPVGPALLSVRVWFRCYKSMQHTTTPRLRTAESCLLVRPRADVKKTMRKTLLPVRHWCCFYFLFLESDTCGVSSTSVTQPKGAPLPQAVSFRG